MTVRIQKDEWYPVYTISSSKEHPSDESVEMTKEELRQFKAAMTAFNRCQEMIDRKLKAQK